jgi:glycosyltransferase involved in cell wall biosynthesis
MTKILSICIPTYNRAKALDRLLKNIGGQIRGIEAEIEICISDNCSSDGTGEVVRKWEGKLPLVYSRNPSNLGFDRNLLAAVSIAGGKFLWCSGDDDLFTPDAIPLLVRDLKAIGTKDVGAVYVAGPKHKIYNNMGFGDFRIFKRGECPPLENLSFIGCICISRKAVRKIIEGKLEVRGSRVVKKDFGLPVLHAFIHTYFFAECLKSGQYIGIAPGYGIQGVDDGEAFSQRRYIKSVLLHLEYIRDLKGFYPEIKPLLPRRRERQLMGGTVKYLLLYGVIFSKKNELDRFYRMQYLLLRKLLEGEKDRLGIMLLDLGNRLRKNRIYSRIILMMFSIFKSVRGSKVAKVTDANINAVSEDIYSSFKEKIGALPDIRDDFDETALGKCLDSVLD